MRPAISTVSLFFLLLLLATTAQGIRLGEQSSATSHKKLHEKESLIVGGSGGSRPETLCKDDELCSGTAGRSRKLITKIMATQKSERNDATQLNTTQKHHHAREEVKRDNENFNVKPPAAEHKRQPPETYPDLLDIAGMDYSPAKRKPPIHN